MLSVQPLAGRLQRLPVLALLLHQHRPARLLSRRLRLLENLDVLAFLVPQHLPVHRERLPQLLPRVCQCPLVPDFRLR